MDRHVGNAGWHGSATASVDSVCLYVHPIRGYASYIQYAVVLWIRTCLHDILISKATDRTVRIQRTGRSSSFCSGSTHIPVHEYRQRITAGIVSSSDGNRHWGCLCIPGYARETDAYWRREIEMACSSHLFFLDYALIQAT